MRQAAWKHSRTPEAALRRSLAPGTPFRSSFAIAHGRMLPQGEDRGRG
jgi:hypothetical protein